MSGEPIDAAAAHAPTEEVGGLARDAEVGRYRVARLLGRGGMGAVYAAEDTLLARSVALKLLALPADLTGSRAGDARLRLLREARAAAAIEHPNVVAIYDVGEHDGAPFLAMELVAGQTLRARLDAASTPAEKARWMREIAAALTAAHARGLVHRDIKPENVMVRGDGSVKVLDFGIARRTGALVDPHAPTDAVGASPRHASGISTITEAGAVVGTPRYMAPEQLRGDDVDARADQFAWGVVAYEVFAGALPWDASSGAALIASVLERDPPPLTAAAGAPAALVAVVERALAKDPGKRFPTMAALAVAFDAAVGAPAAEPSVTGRRRPRWQLAAVLGAVVVAGAAALALRSPAPKPVIAAASPASASAAIAPEPAGVAITSLPLPRSSNAGALAAYKAGLQALRDGSESAALLHFKRARDLDGSLAAAYLRGYVPWNSGEPADEQRELLRQAIDRRSDLPEHEARLLDALAPCGQGRGGDDPHCTRRLAELSRQFPRDAEYAYVLGAQLNVAGQMARSRDAHRRALALDPEYGGAMEFLGTTLRYLGADAEAAKLYAACEAQSGGMDCFIGEASVAADHGDVAELERSARRALDVDANSASALAAMLDVAAARGQPEAALRALNGRYLALLDPVQQAAWRPRLEQRLAWRVGDFVAVRRILDDARPAFAAVKERRFVHDVAEIRASLADETGDLDDAADAARDFFDRFDALVGRQAEDDGALAGENVGVLLRALRRAGKITREAAKAQRDAWIARWEPRLGPDYRPFLWVQAYARGVVDAEDAREALDALPRFGGEPPFDPHVEAVGHMYLLLDRPDDALPYLERAAGAVAPFWPAAVWASLWLGEAREAKRDAVAACAAYARVLERRGHARPRSATADEARRRSRALRCAAPR
ncbi:MAG TPA: protein kinase [Byssovorax sp.]|jgi:serine/threonine-protein kinase